MRRNERKKQDWAETLGKSSRGESHLFQIVLRQSQTQREEQQHKYEAAVLRSDSQQTLNFSLEKKVYENNFITALQTLQDQDLSRRRPHDNTKIKEYFTQKLKLSSFVVPNLHEFLSSVEDQRLAETIIVVHTTQVIKSNETFYVMKKHFLHAKNKETKYSF